MLRRPSAQVTTRPEISDVTETRIDQKWNSPPVNIGRVAATYWCFILLGSNDSSYGVFIPQIEKYYNISYIQVSLIFLSPVLGFIVSTLANHTIHVRLGQRGVIVIAGTCQLVAYVIACLHPPFPALVVVYALVGLGCGAKQAAWNSFISGLHNSNELLGLLHGCYGIGATISPVVASVLTSQKGWMWYQFYYILIGMAAMDIIFSFSMFATQSGKVYKEKTWLELQDVSGDSPAGTIHAHDEQADGGEITRRPSQVFHALKGSRTLDCLKTKPVLLCSGFLLAYVGSEVALGGWLVTFMIKVRGGSAVASGITSSGLWAGITLGRIILGFVTGRFFKSEKWAVSAYLAMAMVMELLFWLIPSFLASAINVAFLGFFLGPLFPAVIVTISRLLPGYLQVPAIGICSAIGASGASIIPYMVGAIAQARGVAVLQPIIFALLVLCLILWAFLSRLPANR